jgi:hypothetical protein
VRKPTCLIAEALGKQKEAVCKDFSEQERKKTHSSNGRFIKAGAKPTDTTNRSGRVVWIRKLVAPVNRLLRQSHDFQRRMPGGDREGDRTAGFRAGNQDFAVLKFIAENRVSDFRENLKERLIRLLADYASAFDEAVDEKNPIMCHSAKRETSILIAVLGQHRFDTEHSISSRVYSRCRYFF